MLLAKLHDLHEYWTYIAITMEHYFFASLTKQREDYELVKNQEQSNQSMNWTERQEQPEGVKSILVESD